MQYKGYPVEFVEVRWDAFRAGALVGDYRHADLIAKIGNSNVMIDGLTADRENPLSIVVRRNFERYGYTALKCLTPFTRYEFQVISSLDRSILREALEEHGAADTMGNETCFWERLLNIQAKLTQTGSHTGAFITAWAIDERTTYVAVGDGDVCAESETDWELLGYLGPNMELVLDVPFGWLPNVDPFEYYISQERTADPSLGLELYVRGFDYQTAWDEVTK